MSNDPLEECFGGEEATDEVHGFWHGVWTRLEGKPSAVPIDELTPEEAKACTREIAYYKFGWHYADILLGIISWVKENVNWRRAKS